MKREAGTQRLEISCPTCWHFPLTLFFPTLSFKYLEQNSRPSMSAQESVYIGTEGHFLPKMPIVHSIQSFPFGGYFFLHTHYLQGQPWKEIVVWKQSVFLLPENDSWISIHLCQWPLGIPLGDYRCKAEGSSETEVDKHESQGLLFRYHTYVLWNFKDSILSISFLPHDELLQCTPNIMSLWVW